MASWRPERCEPLILYTPGNKHSSLPFATRRSSADGDSPKVKHCPRVTVEYCCSAIASSSRSTSIMVHFPSHSADNWTRFDTDPCAGKGEGKCGEIILDA
jgi:hypothetical protein